MSNFSDYLIVTDLDGTLYENQNNIPDANRKAIKGFVENQGNFAVATGRGIDGARFIMDEVEINCPVITCNGHAIYDYHKEKMIKASYLPNDVKDFTFNIFNKFKDVGIEVHLEDEIHILRSHEIVQWHMDYSSLSYCYSDFETVKNRDWLKMIVVEQFEKLNIVREYAKNIKTESFRTINSESFFMEVLKSGVDKGTAVLDLAKILNIPKDNIFTIGNYYNDIELVKSGKVGAFVKNSPEDLKEQADFVTKLTCDEGALAEFINFVMSFKNSSTVI